MKYWILIISFSLSGMELQKVSKSTHIHSHDLPAVAQPRPEFIQEMNERATPSTEASEDTIPKRHHNKRMIYSNSVTALLATCVTAGVTLAIHFSNCKS